ncbi:hypothetical protein S245_070287, partial [Arachis hypogaea]
MLVKPFSDWLIFSHKPREPNISELSLIKDKYLLRYNDYQLAKDHFHTLAKDNEFKNLCFSLYDWYKSGKQSSYKFLIRCMTDLKPLWLHQSVAKTECGVLKGHANAIEEGLVVVDGDGVILCLMSLAISSLRSSSSWRGNAISRRPSTQVPPLRGLVRRLFQPEQPHSIQFATGYARSSDPKLAGINKRGAKADHHNKFKTLMKSPDFSQVYLSLYWGDERLQFAYVSLRSRDEKVWDFHKIYGSRWIKEGLVVVDHFRGWITEFLKNNIDMLSELYE